VRIFLAVPGTELIVDREPREIMPMRACTWRCAMRSTPHGRVTRLFSTEGYGFIETADGREVYFHGNSLLEADLASLQIGDEVRFVEEPGDEAQATSVRLMETSAPHLSQVCESAYNNRLARQDRRPRRTHSR
jgi:cold shock CspA family protein